MVYSNLPTAIPSPHPLAYNSGDGVESRDTSGPVYGRGARQGRRPYPVGGILADSMAIHSVPSAYWTDKDILPTTDCCPEPPQIDLKFHGESTAS